MTADTVAKDARLVVAMIPFGPRPPAEDPQSMTLVGVGRALSQHPELRVLQCPWPRLYFDDARVTLRGTVYEQSDRTMRPVRLDAPLAPDAVLFFPQGGLGKPGTNSDETDALVRFASLDLGTATRARHHLVRRLVAEASRRGVVTNSAIRDESWGLKDHLELTLRAYEAHTACRVPRPDTWIASGPEVERVVAELGRRGVDVVIKAAGGARAEAIHVWRAGQPGPPPTWNGPTVVQELLRDPLLLDGHKVDLRCFALIDTSRREASFRPRAVMVRFAGARYDRALPEAEITNTPFRRRMGLGTAIFPLDELPAVKPALRAALHERLDQLIGDFIDAFFWNARPRGGKKPATATTTASSGAKTDAAPRLLLWGMDVLVGGTEDRFQLQLLEANVFPTLLPYVPACDAAATQLVTHDYGDALVAACRRAAPSVAPAASPPASAPASPPASGQVLAPVAVARAAAGADAAAPTAVTVANAGEPAA